MNKRIKYDKEFKLSAIKLLEDSGETINKIEKDMGIARGNLRRWIEDKNIKKDNCFPGNGNSDGNEIVKLKKENKFLKEERDILKKAIGIFS